MKKLVLSVALVATGLFASAQEVSYGVKAGANFATVGGSDVEDADELTSYHVGGYANIKLDDQFAIQPEVLVSGQGAGEWKPTYINIPVMAKYYFAEGFNAELGPQLGFMVGKDDLENENVVDFGLAAGVGYELENGLNFGVRYVYGITNVMQDFKAQNRVLQVGVGYTFKK